MNDQERIVAMEEQVSFSRRLIPGALSLVLFSVFVAFMIGYFLGVKYTTDEFVTQIRQETLADQLLISSGVQNFSNNSEISEAAMLLPADATVTASLQVPAPEQSTDAVVTPINPVRYGAELIGFGTKAAAEEFLQRVARYNTMTLVLKERQSKTPRGRLVTWYQVVTGKYEQKPELQKLLDTLIKKERLHDIKIVAYAPSAKDLA